MDHLDQLRFDDIERRQVTYPSGFPPILLASLASPPIKLMSAQTQAFFIRARDDIEFLLRVVRDYERPH